MKLEMVALKKIKIPYNLRTELKTKFLSSSIKNMGQINPLIVDKDYNLLSGYRRFKALKRIGKHHKVYVITRNVNDVLQFQLIENLQREDLNPIDKANAFKKFITQRHISGREAANILGISKSVIEFHLKLLELPKEIQKKLLGGELKPYSLENLVYKKRIKNVEDFLAKDEATRFTSLFNRLISFIEYLKKANLNKQQLQILGEKLVEAQKIIEKG